MRERAVPSSLEASRGRADRLSRKNHLIPENSRSRAQPQDELLVLEAPTPRRVCRTLGAVSLRIRATPLKQTKADPTRLLTPRSRTRAESGVAGGSAAATPAPQPAGAHLLAPLLSHRRPGHHCTEVRTLPPNRHDRVTRQRTAPREGRASRVPDGWGGNCPHVSGAALRQV